MEYKNSLERVKNSIFQGEVEKILGYNFYNKTLLLIALTHKSYIYYFRQEYIFSNERLEFLGDAVLGLVISEILMEKYPDYKEGVLTKIKSRIVSEAVLYKIAKQIHLEKYILLGKSEFVSNNHKKNSIIADAMESIIGAIYKDGGLEAARFFIKKHFNKYIEDSNKENFLTDYKSLLQEIVQKKYKIKPEYKIVKEEGPEHNKMFYVKVYVKNKEYGTGTGKNKKEAEQNAAHNAVKLIEH